MDDESDHSLFDLIKSLLRKKTHLDKSADLTEEIHDFMNEGQAKGLISGEESDMVYGVLDLKEIKVHSIMLPRTEISSSSIDPYSVEVVVLKRSPKPLI